MTTAAERIGPEDAALAVKLWGLANSVYQPTAVAGPALADLRTGLRPTGDPIAVLRALAEAITDIADGWERALPPPPASSRAAKPRRQRRGI